jgi:protoheme IX farnesyltransferase
MSDTVNILSAPVAVVSTRIGPLARAVAYVELSKPRIAVLVLVATAAGFFMGLPAGADWPALFLMLHTIFAVAIVATGANALNHYWEAPHDARMLRTSGRPIPTGRLNPLEVRAFGWGFGLLGVLWLLLFTNAGAALLAALSLTLYVLVYTPLKRVTSLCVYVGAVPGALPPVIGWTAAAGSITADAWPLFAILFLWQLPHFAAIAWLYREDYARAGYPMLPVLDPSGRRTDLHMITHTLGLMGVSLLPVVQGGAGVVYAAGAMLLGLAFLAFGAYFVMQKSNTAARAHLLASVAYIPALCTFLIADKLSRSLLV